MDILAASNQWAAYKCIALGLFLPFSSPVFDVCKNLN